MFGWNALAIMLKDTNNFTKGCGQGSKGMQFTHKPALACTLCAWHLDLSSWLARPVVLLLGIPARYRACFESSHAAVSNFLLQLLFLAALPLCACCKPERCWSFESTVIQINSNSDTKSSRSHIASNRYIVSFAECRQVILSLRCALQMLPSHCKDECHHPSNSCCRERDGQKTPMLTS